MTEIKHKQRSVMVVTLNDRSGLDLGLTPVSDLTVADFLAKECQFVVANWICQ